MMVCVYGGVGAIALYLFNIPSCCWLSGRARRSPKQRVKEQLNGGAREADKDQLISEDSDGIYRRCPGVNNVAYVVGDRLLC